LVLNSNLYLFIFFSYKFFKLNFITTYLVKEEKIEDIILEEDKKHKKKGGKDSKKGGEKVSSQ
jgi:hypothetical protein